ncbi:MAG: ATP-binding cassette domain-containing protein [Azospirillaceae bacterium]
MLGGMTAQADSDDAPASGPRAGRAHVEVTDLVKTFDVSQPWLVRTIAGAGRRVVRAVDHVSFAIERGRTLGLVGESGCGKSTVARCLAGLLSLDGGTVRFAGEEADATQDMTVRQQIQMVFQDPYSSLNPRWRVREAIGDALLAFGIARNRREMRVQVAALLESVGLSAADAERYPHQFSGGQRQRVAIARAIASRPTFLIADEPTSALDVSVQAQILNLMKALQKAHRLTYLFISHDLGVVDHMADTVGVMYLGRIVELRSKADLFDRPLHPYTRMLMDTVPTLERPGEPRKRLAGEVPSPLDPPPGCAFHPRCPLAGERCRVERPAVLPVAGGGVVACHAVEEGRAG